jgi:hypothetical protein
MLRNLKCFAWILLAALAVQSASGFSLLGPENEDWQIPDNGYNGAAPYDPLLTGPKNIGEEYRRNTPVLYYTFDATFLDFFGSNGVVSVEQAISTINALTNVSQYSRGLTEFPLSAIRQNFRATALNLLDLKSQTMHFLVEQLGLAEPERYVWTLHDRFLLPGATCPAGMVYLTVKRNFDPVPSPLDQYQSSSYVNGALYSYFIVENCQSPPGPPLAEAVEFPVDQLDLTYTAIASEIPAGPVPFTAPNALALLGRFYTGLTRDDVGGLRYLLRTNNMNWESIPANGFGLVTNTAPQILVSSNLTLLAAQALTNDPGTLQALFPGITIVNSSNYFVTTWVTNVTPYFTNSPYDPALTPPRLAFATNRVLTVQQQWVHVFDNLRIVTFTNGTWTTFPVSNFSELSGVAINTLETINVSASSSPYTPAGGSAVTTNLTTRSFATNTVVGEFLILPTNACDVVLLSSQLTITNRNTNIIVQTFTNVTTTNITTGTNVTIPLEFTQQLIDYSTSHVFAALPITCVQSNIVLAQGIEKLSFVRHDYDSLLGRFFTPITNEYTMTILTNNTLRPMRVLQPVTAPDFIFTAADLAAGPSEIPGNPIYARNINFGSNALAFYPGLAGPGTIESSPNPTFITYNKVGQIFGNSSFNAYRWDVAEISATTLFTWGSFDASTNAPVVYPNGTTLENIENQMMFLITPNSLPEGQRFVPYEATIFNAVGGKPPYTWTLAPGSGPIPAGLTLSPSGTLSGTPTFPATYNFVIRLTDASGRTVDREYSIKINL